MSTAGPPIDRAHLARYTLGDTALEREVLDLFREQLVRTLPQLTASASEKDWRLVAHTLKGSGRAVGAWRLSAAAAAAEAAFEHGAGARGDLVRAVEEAAREVIDHLEAARR
ncbi:MAG: Hpt domain-containing protein [Pseudomonadota bacterium]